MLGRHIERIDDVLEPDREAVQRAALISRYGVELARRRKDCLGVKIGPGMDVRLAGLDASDESTRAAVNSSPDAGPRLGHSLLLDTQLSRAQEGPDLARCELVKRP